MVMSEIFWTFLVTSVIGMFLAIIRMMYKSKCYEFSCLCFTIKRNIELEAEEHKFDIEHGVIPKKQESSVSL